MPATATGFIAGLRYPSGREIYVGRQPRLAQWTATPATAHVWATEEQAMQAADALMQAFELRSALQAFVLPSSP